MSKIVMKGMDIEVDFNIQELNLRKIVVYVAGKYSAPTRKEFLENAKKALKVSKEIWKAGFTAICPHGNTYDFWKTEPKIDHEDYLVGDFQLIDLSNAIFMLDDWQISKGAVEEHRHAKEIGIPIFYDDIEKLKAFPWKEQYIEFRNIINKMYHLHVKKNMDYSPANILGTGEIGLVTRLWDKTARLLNLVGFKIDVEFKDFEKPKDPKNESLDDTYMDAAVYSIIGLILRKGKWGV